MSNRPTEKEGTMKNILRALSLSIILLTLYQAPSAMAQAAASSPAMDKFKADMKTAADKC